MDRRTWYEDDGGGPDRASTLNFQPIGSWSANSLLMLTLAVIFFVQLVFPGFSSWFDLRPVDLVNPLRWYELVTYSLLHDDRSILHLGFNCLMLFFFGPPVEALVGGRKPYVAFCAAGAASAALAYVMVAVLWSNPSIPMIGASGICYAVLVALATYDPQREVMLIVIPVKLWALATILMVAALFLQLMSPGDGVAHPAHLGGGVFGFLFVRYRSRFRGAVAQVQSKRAQARWQQQVDRKAEIDRLLEKISESGITSLTRAERRFLDSASKEMRKRD